MITITKKKQFGITSILLISKKEINFKKYSTKVEEQISKTVIHDDALNCLSYYVQNHTRKNKPNSAKNILNNTIGNKRRN